MLTVDDPSDESGRHDDVDRRILAELRTDGRIGPGELAGRLGLSRTTVTKRLASILGDGRTRVVGLVHPTTLGISSYAHVSVATVGSGREVAARLCGRPEIPFVSLVCGEFPMVVEVRARDDASLSAVLDSIRALDGVESTETLLYTDLVRDVMSSGAVSADWLDDLDRRILALLQADGRLPYSAIAAGTGVSVGTARTRTLRLIDSGVVTIDVIPGSAGGRKVDIGLGFRVRGTVGESTAILTKIPEIRFLAATLGRYDIVATMQVDSQRHAAPALERVRALSTVVHVHGWVHLEPLKEDYSYPMAIQGARRYGGIIQ
ncbi:Lrp/AsnC family transcriptional regulator [Millisia brevis]|uniref:Lrp/AsnC family transcriptional regulator n=1 Tax=Millisia brevis TaxID=264148 RepID=UPI00082E857B|nr:Lrp/AsnC family transcriptional regulator [Millisia brevis]